MLVLQYEAATANHDKLLALHNALRKERDELWAQVEAAKSSAAGLQHERDEALARLAALRAEVKQSMDDVVNDRWGCGLRNLQPCNKLHHASACCLHAAWIGLQALVSGLPSWLRCLLLAGTSDCSFQRCRVSRH